MKMTPDGTPHLPPFVNPDEETPGSSNQDEPSAGALLAVVLLALFSVVMIFMVNGSGIGGEARLFPLLILAALVVDSVRILFFQQPASLRQAPEREVRIETIRETVKVRCSIVALSAL